jgi:hypothetical protein
VPVDIDVDGVRHCNGKDLHYQGPGRTEKSCSAQDLEGGKCSKFFVHEKGVHELSKKV